jgi:hypothetical protein
MSNTKSKPVLHTITTPDGVVHTRKSPRVYAVAIVVTNDPIKHNLWLAKVRQEETVRAHEFIAKYEAGLATAGDERVTITNARGNYENTLFSKADYREWIASARAGIASRDAEIAKALADAANPATKPVYWVLGWSQTEKQGHATARSASNRWVSQQGCSIEVLPATRHA